MEAMAFVLLFIFMVLLSLGFVGGLFWLIVVYWKVFVVMWVVYIAVALGHALPAGDKNKRDRGH